MNAQINFVKRAITLLFMGISLPAAASAQLISIKSVPVATGDQFLLFPSQNLGMGSVSIALDDPMLDPFINPAKGARMKGAFIFSSPTFYGISDDMGAARSLPLSILVGSDQRFGGLFLAAQQMESAEPDGFRTFQLGPKSPGGRFSNNTYALGLFGRNLNGSNTAIGGSVFWADLDAVDGVDLLYPGSQDIEQFGSILDLRMGLISELSDDRSLEAMLLYNRFDMTHDVTYNDWRWIEDLGNSIIDTRMERNLDRSRTWGVHLGYVVPIGSDGWRLGGIMTGNWVSHPKIPNYELMNIPRDPGNSWAYNIGLGFSRSEKLSVVGIDFIYEPILSNTWADAAERIETPIGRIILPGGKTVENDFQFSNYLLRLGFTSQENERFGIQFGLQVRSIGYKLVQNNYVQEFRRKQRERWQEWTASFGLILNLQELQVKYQGRWTTGTGQPGVSGNATLESAGDSRGFQSIIVAPSGSLTLLDAHVITHRITVSIPITSWSSK